MTDKKTIERVVNSHNIECRGIDKNRRTVGAINPEPVIVITYNTGRVDAICRYRCLDEELKVPDRCGAPLHKEDHGYCVYHRR